MLYPRKEEPSVITIWCDEHAKYMNVFNQTFNLSLRDVYFAGVASDYLREHPELKSVLQIKDDIVTLTGTVEGFFQGFKAYQMALDADPDLPESDPNSKRSLYTLALELMTMRSICKDPTDVNTLGNCYFDKLASNELVRGHKYWHHNRSEPSAIEGHANAVMSSELGWLFRFSNIDAACIYKKEALAQYLMFMRATQNIDFLALLMHDIGSTFHEKSPPADNFWGYPGYDALGKIITRLSIEIENELENTGAVRVITSLPPELCALLGMPTNIAVIQSDDSQVLTKDRIDTAIEDIRVNGRNEEVLDYAGKKSFERFFQAGGFPPDRSALALLLEQNQHGFKFGAS